MKTTMVFCLFVTVSMVIADNGYYVQDNPNFYQHESYKVAPIQKSKHVVIKPCLDYGLFEDPNDCGAFFQCSPAGLVRIKCAKGNLYDRNIKRCNSKEFVPCYSGVSCPRPFGVYPNPRFCNKFLNCFANIPYIQACPAGLVFNAIAPGKGFCDYPKNVNCEDNKIAVIKVHKPVIVKHPVHTPVEQPLHILVVKQQNDNKPVIVKHPVSNPVVQPIYTPVVKETVYTPSRYDSDDSK